jgi:hypothetical protein
VHSYPAGVDVIEVERLRSDLLLRPLSRPAVRVARELLEVGRLDAAERGQLMELEEYGLATFTQVDGEGTFFPRRLLRHLEEFGLLGILDDPNH